MAQGDDKEEAMADGGVKKRLALAGTAGLALAMALGVYGLSVHPLHMAVSMDLEPVSRALLMMGLPVEGRDGLGRTPLHEGAIGNNPHQVVLLLEQGAALDPRDDLFHWTPLHFAAAFGHGECARLLLEAGADPNAVAPRGMTALHLAAGAGFEDIARLLVAHGADVTGRETRGMDVAAMAQEAGVEDTARWLARQARPSVALETP